MAEIAPALVNLAVPVVGQLEDRRALGLDLVEILGRGEVDQRVFAGAVLVAIDLDEAEQIAVKAERFVEVVHAHHRMQVFHVGFHRKKRPGLSHSGEYWSAAPDFTNIGQNREPMP